MYVTIKEAAELLSVSEAYVLKLIKEKRVRALFDGKDYILYKDQFDTHFNQLEKYLKLVEELHNEPIPEDIDIRDED
ncbi:excisionase family DNA-binding protein [Bacillus salitolerans]|uniref:Excisionase family DNA-binding protein n=1 Tax=Bacillus salitolerans TaxID=1437434 RepID=A0ABW4LXN9_9BACI